MGSLEKAKKVMLVFGGLTAALVFWATPSYGKQPGVDLRSESNQVGIKAGLAKAEQTEDKTVLAFGLFLQVIALVAVTVALAGHLTLPAKPKSTKP